MTTGRATRRNRAEIKRGESDLEETRPKSSSRYRDRSIPLLATPDRLSPPRPSNVSLSLSVCFSLGRDANEYARVRVCGST